MNPVDDETGTPAIVPTGRPPLRARDHLLAMGARTYVMAILNLTHDSFSGDGTGADLDRAVRRAVRADEEGADILDIGAESARADAPGRIPEEEAALIAEAVHRVSREIDLLISIDTYKGAVAEAGLQAGAHMINDIGGFMIDDATARAAAKHGAALVINYTVERPKIRPAQPPQYADLVEAHLAFFRRRIRMATDAGVAAGCLIIDPGIAFGKSHDEDIEMLRNLSAFRAFKLPILVAASRKHFIGSIIGDEPKARDDATVAVTALSIASGADLVRVHNVRRNVQAARITDAIVRGRLGDYAPSRESWPWWEKAEPIAGTTIEHDD